MGICTHSSCVGGTVPTKGLVVVTPIKRKTEEDIVPYVHPEPVKTMCWDNHTHNGLTVEVGEGLLELIPRVQRWEVPIDHSLSTTSASLHKVRVDLSGRSQQSHDMTEIVL